MNSEKVIQKQFLLNIDDQEYLDILEYFSTAIVTPKFTKNRMLHNIYEGKIERVIFAFSSEKIDFSAIKKLLEKAQNSLKSHAEIVSGLEINLAIAEENVRSMKTQNVLLTETLKQQIHKHSEERRDTVEVFEKETRKLQTENDQLKKVNDELKNEAGVLFEKVLNSDQTIAKLKSELENIKSQNSDLSKTIEHQTVGLDLLRLDFKEQQSRQNNSVFETNKSWCTTSNQEYKKLIGLFKLESVRRFLVHFCCNDSLLKLMSLNKVFKVYFAEDSIISREVSARKFTILTNKLALSVQKNEHFKEEGEKHKASFKRFIVYKHLYWREENKNLADLENSILNAFDILSRVHSSHGSQVIQGESKSFFGKLKSQISKINSAELVFSKERKYSRFKKIHSAQKSVFGRLRSELQRQFHSVSEVKHFQSKKWRSRLQNQKHRRRSSSKGVSKVQRAICFKSNPRTY